MPLNSWASRLYLDWREPPFLDTIVGIASKDQYLLTNKPNWRTYNFGKHYGFSSYGDEGPGMPFHVQAALLET